MKFYKYAIASIALLSIGYYSYQQLSPSTVMYVEETEEDERRTQIERAEAEFKMLKNPKTNTIPRTAAREAYLAAEKQLDDQLKSNTSTLPSFTIESRGPGNFGGRTRGLDFDVRNPLIGVSGGVSGGIFRTTDGANSWTKVTPAGQIHHLSTLAQDKSTGNEDIWYAASGEQSTSAGAIGANYYGNGVWKSTDNGLTWNLLAITTGTLEAFDSDWDFVHRILVDPTNGDVYAGNTGGVYRSTDQGVTWTNVLPAPFPSEETLVEIIRSSDGTFYAAVDGEGVWKSTSGNTGAWTQIADFTLLNNPQRIVLNYAPSAPNIIYALYNVDPFSCGGSIPSKVRLRRWDNAASGGAGAWTGNYDTAISVCDDVDFELDPQGGYNLCVAVRPNDPDEIFIGGERVYRFTITGVNTGIYDFAGGDQGSPTLTNVHVDQHFLLFTDNNTLWSTNDGGIRSTDASTTPDFFEGFEWDNKSVGLVTYQYYRGDISPTLGSNLVGGGAQDNANSIIPTGSTDMTELGGGDGVQFALMSGTDLTDFMAITSTQSGSMERYTPTNGGVDITVPSTGDELQGFLTYFLLDADNVEHLYYPAEYEFVTGDKSELYRTRTASTVGTVVTNNSATGWEKLDISSIEDQESITAMAVSHNAAFGNAAYSSSDANRKMYIGTDGGYVYRVTDPAFASNLNLVDISTLDMDGYVSDIAINPTDDKEIMITLSSYGVSSIFHTMDATAGTVIWTEVEGTATGAVAKASIRSAIITSVGGNPLYIVGTSTGLYGTQTLSGSSTTWERIGANTIAYAVCADMRLRTADNKIGLASHGNGMFVVCPTDDPCPPDYAGGNQLTGNQTATVDYETDGIIESNQILQGNSVTVDYDSKICIELKPDFEVQLGTVFSAFIDGCGGSALSDEEENEGSSTINK